MLKEILKSLKILKTVFEEKGLKAVFLKFIIYSKELIYCFFILRRDVLFVVGCSGGSQFYRCNNQAEVLSLYGLNYSIIGQNNLCLRQVIKKHKIFIFQRVIFNESIEKIIREIKKQNKKIIFETDDLVFDSKYLKFLHYYYYMSDQEKKWYKNGIGREILEDDYIKHCITSTDFLAEKIKEKYFNKKVFVSYNQLSKKQVEQANKVLKNKNKFKMKNDKLKIGYFSGSKSHDADFGVIEDVLFKILKNNKKVQLVIVGFLKLNKKFDLVKNQIKFYSFVDLKKLPELISNVDINIAPLEIENPFCQAKSALKFFEAGILEVPTIATGTQPFEKIIQNSKTGFLAYDIDDWKKYLELLINNKNKREKIGKNARVFILKNNVITKNNKNKDLVDFIMSVI